VALIARGCLTRNPPLESQLKSWMLEIMLLMSWREFELLERLQFMNVQRIYKYIQIANRLSQVG